ncbi:MAG: hypothetical protein OEV87_07935 [Phycisphaerae bacterium]|nr:hypothetical protein [Phycisphaerae bacterium]
MKENSELESSEQVLDMQSHLSNSVRVEDEADTEQMDADAVSNSSTATETVQETVESQHHPTQEAEEPPQTAVTEVPEADTERIDIETADDGTDTQPNRGLWANSNAGVENKRNTKDPYQFMVKAKKAIGYVGKVFRYYLGGYPIQVAGRQRPLVKVGDISGSLELSYDQQTDKRQRSGASSENESRLTREQLNLRAKGDVFDPRLMSYDLFGGFGLSQQSYQTNTQSDSSSGDLQEYGFNAHFVPTKPYPFSIEASRSDELLTRAFQSPLRVQNSHEGFHMNLRVPEWPMTFSWSQSDLSQDSDVVSSQTDLDRSMDRFSYTLSHDFSDYSRMTFRSDIDQVTQDSSTFNRDVKTQRHRLLHDLDFGDDKEHRLNTSFSLVDRKEQFDSTTFDWSENLTLKHTENFSTFYNTIYSKSKFDDIDTKTMTGLAGFVHQLYQNLTTTGDIYTSKSEFGAFSETNSRGGDLILNYSRHNPWGVFLAVADLNYGTDKTTGESGIVPVTDETHVFNDPFPFKLNQRNIDPTSILVTDITGLLVYTEDDDYTINVIGDEVEITATTLGTEFPNISDGQTLFVDYLYELTGDTTENISRREIRLKQRFDNGLSIYVSRWFRDREVDSDIDPDIMDQNMDSMLYGAEYQWKRFTFIGEHSETDSNFESTKSDRLGVRTYWPLSARTSLNGGISQTWIDTSGQIPRESELFRADGKIRTRLSRYLNLTGRAEYRKEDDSQIGPTDGYRIGASLDYNRASLSIRAGWDTYFLDRQSVESDSTRFYLDLIRRF